MGAKEPFLVMGRPVFIGKFKTVVSQQQKALLLAKKKMAAKVAAANQGSGTKKEEPSTSSDAVNTNVKGKSEGETTRNEPAGSDASGAGALDDGFSLFNFDFSTPMPGLLDISSMWEGGSSSGFSLFGGNGAPAAAGGRDDMFSDLATSMAVSVIGTSPTNPPGLENGRKAPPAKRTSAPPGFSNGDT